MAADADDLYEVAGWGIQAPGLGFWGDSPFLHVTTTAKTLTGVSRITQTATRTITGKARIQFTRQQTIPGKSRVQQTRTQPITGTAHIFYIRQATITGLARILGLDINTKPYAKSVQMNPRIVRIEPNF